MTNDERYDIMATIKDPDVPFAKKGNYIGKILRDYPSFKKHEILTALDMISLLPCRCSYSHPSA